MLILLVEDDDAIALYLRVVLESEGYATVRAADAVSATAWLETSTPDLIVADLNIPGSTDGSFLRWVRDRVELRFVPIVLCSGSGPQQLRDFAAACAPASYVRKPFDPDVLVAACARLLSQPVGDIA